MLGGTLRALAGKIKPIRFMLHTMDCSLMGDLARMQIFSPIVFFIRIIDKAVVCVDTDHLENDTIPFHMNYLQRYSALSC